MALTVPAPYANDMLGWFTFDQQPAQRDFGISTVADDHGRLLEYHREELATWPSSCGKWSSGLPMRQA
jgi:hypothetical protein